MKRVGELVPAFQQKVQQMTEKDLTHVDSPNNSTSRATGGKDRPTPSERLMLCELGQVKLLKALFYARRHLTAGSGADLEYIDSVLAKFGMR